MTERDRLESELMVRSGHSKMCDRLPVGKRVLIHSITLKFGLSRTSSTLALPMLTTDSLL